MNGPFWKRWGGVIALCAGVFGVASGIAKDEPLAKAPENGRLAIVWTSGDPEVAHRMCLMFGHAAKQAGWFKDVTLVVWGPSARLLAADKDLQAKVRAMGADGVIVQACVVCADSYGVSERLRSMDIEVKPMGRPLADMIQGGWSVLTF